MRGQALSITHRPAETSAVRGWGQSTRYGGQTAPAFAWDSPLARSPLARTPPLARYTLDLPLFGRYHTAMFILFAIVAIVVGIVLLWRARTVRAIAGNTFAEAVRQPVYLLTLFAAMLMVVLLGTVPLFAMMPREEMALTAELSVSTITLAGLVLAIFTASGVVHDEIERKTILVVLARGVRRWQFLVGKYLGVLAAVALAMALVTLAAEAGLLWKFATAYELELPLRDIVHRFISTGPDIPWGAVRAMTAEEVSATGVRDGWAAMLATGAVLSLGSVSVLVAVAVAASTRLAMPAASVLCVGAYSLGHLVDYLSRREFDSAAGAFARDAVVALAPNLSVYDVIHALGRGVPVDAAYIVTALGYAVVYVAAILVSGHLLLRRMDLS